MKKVNYFFILAFALLLAIPALAQDVVSLSDCNSERLLINRKGMFVLGSWAIGNMAYSGYSYYQSNGSTRYFHQMNVFWNFVNLGLAGSGIYDSFQTLQSMNLLESIAAQHNIEKILLLNTGLDVAYMSIGLYLNERSKRGEKRAEMLAGYGKSLILQGAFLFLFDLGFYAAHTQHGKKLNKIIQQIELSSSGIGLNYSF